MSGGVVAVPDTRLVQWWRWLRNPAFWMKAADVFAVLSALVLPWSTSLLGIFAACWIGAAALIVDYRAYFQSLKQPICALPLALFALAAVGMLWSDASWSERLYAVGPTVKLLFLPGLFHYFERSSRGMWVFAAFAISCALLMCLSWIVWFAPEFKVTATLSAGIPVKNYIDQTQEFVLCTFALTPLSLSLLHQRRFALATLCAAVILGFVANMVFVAFARTALVYVPAMLALLAARYLSWRATVVLFCAAAMTAASMWWISPYLRSRIELIPEEYHSYMRDNAVTSTGQRLEFWRKSLRFFASSPLYGNGTGSTRRLFEQDAVGQSGVSAEVIGNPHNQALNVAVQWGLIGCFVLFAMWFYHLMMFRGPTFVSWIGLLVVTQNVVSSLVNSHLFDFHEGWMYVLGVGVAGGMVLKMAGQASNEMVK